MAESRLSKLGDNASRWIPRLVWVNKLAWVPDPIPPDTGIEQFGGGGSIDEESANREEWSWCSTNGGATSEFTEIPPGYVQHTSIVWIPPNPNNPSDSGHYSVYTYWGPP